MDLKINYKKHFQKAKKASKKRKLTATLMKIPKLQRFFEKVLLRLVVEDIGNITLELGDAHLSDEHYRFSVIFMAEKI